MWSKTGINQVILITYLELHGAYTREIKYKRGCSTNSIDTIHVFFCKNTIFDLIFEHETHSFLDTPRHFNLTMLWRVYKKSYHILFELPVGIINTSEVKISFFFMFSFFAKKKAFTLPSSLTLLVKIWKASYFDYNFKYQAKKKKKI